MTAKSKRSHVANGALAGAGTGAAAGTAVLPGWGTAIGGAIGAIGGGIGGLFADSAEEESLKNDPEYQAAKRRERTIKMMSKTLGRGFGALKTPAVTSFTSPITGAQRGV